MDRQTEAVRLMLRRRPLSSHFGDVTMVPGVHWLVLFSIVFHGPSIPALNLIYRFCGVKPFRDDAVELL